MSLINQMLKDIEKRSRPHVATSFTPFNSLSARSDTKILKPFVAGIVVLLIILSIASLLIFNRIDKSQARQEKNQSLLQMAAIPADNGLKKIGVEPNHLAATVLTGLTLQITDKTTLLRFVLSQNVLYRVNYDKSHECLIIYLDQTRLVNSLPVINYENSAIRNMKIFNTPQGDLKIVVALHSAVNVQFLGVNTKDKLPELQIQLNLPNLQDAYIVKTSGQAATTSSAAPIKKLVINMLLQDEYKKAVNFSSLGNQAAAIQVLKKIIAYSPGYYPARELLIKLLLQKGDKFNADKYLTLGLHMHPNYIPFIELHGRMLADNNKVKEALTFLKRTSPAIEDHPDYHALIAALYQRQGDSAMAARVYEQLLRLNSNKAVWWVGLGIALEAMDKTSEAMQAYARANTGEELTDELRVYINDRIESV